MSIAITKGGLSYTSIQTVQPEKTERMFIQSLSRLSNYEVLTVHPERQEILLKIKDVTRFNSENLRRLLKDLQDQTQRSYVALISLVSQCILITVRG